MLAPISGLRADRRRRRDVCAGDSRSDATTPPASASSVDSHTDEVLPSKHIAAPPGATCGATLAAKNIRQSRRHQRGDCTTQRRSAATPTTSGSSSTTPVTSSRISAGWSITDNGGSDRIPRLAVPPHGYAILAASDASRNVISGLRRTARACWVHAWAIRWATTAIT